MPERAEFVEEGADSPFDLVTHTAGFLDRRTDRIADAPVLAPHSPGRLDDADGVRHGAVQATGSRRAKRAEGTARTECG
jgi:hypothetical protein